MIIDNDNQLIVLHETPDGRQGAYSLRAILADEPLDAVVLNGLLSGSCCRRAFIAAPLAWGLKSHDKHSGILCCNGHIPLPDEDRSSGDKNGSYLVVSNGRFHTQLDYAWLRKIIASLDADVVLVTVESELSAGQKKLQVTSRGQLAGVRRVYSDSVQRSPMPTDWPCHVFIRKALAHTIFGDGGVPVDFETFIKLISKNASLISVSVGGSFLDIETPQGLLAFVAESLRSSRCGYKLAAESASANAMPAGTRCSGAVIMGKDIRVGENVILLGPAIIGSNAEIADGAMVARSVIGSGVKISPREIIHDRVLMKTADSGGLQEFRQQARSAGAQAENNFRLWPRLSYARFVKRAADIVTAAVVLVLFAPVIAIVALMIKATSSGPVFFGHLRQGLHGKMFHCLKFRSMIVGADELQAKLRTRNEVDGPQFKMDDDPRVTSIGKFLRDTYLDEIPQFFNVLAGNMSVIGPRPSPEAENSLCAYWRDARLSVRPGITGLWQVYRTRKTGSDFQEWVHYDLHYVRHLSLRLDLLMCWKTARYLIKAFLKQF